MIKETITIISPHQDDAALSLGNFIVRRRPTSINIVNCYTVSEYSPFHQRLNRVGVMKKRSEEDKIFRNHKRGANIRLINLNEPDGPIRLNTGDMETLLTERVFSDRDIEHLSSLRREMAGHLKGMLLLPLGIGGHIDHILACIAGLSLIKEYTLFAFYLDVPYWLRVSLERVQQRARYIEAFAGISLTPHIDSLPEAWDKRLLSQIYSSQITEKEVLQIVNAPFMGEIILASTNSIATKLSLQEVRWTDLNH